MKAEIMIDNLTSPRNESRRVGYWPNGVGENKVPIYHVDTIHELNRLVGYAKFINGKKGTVLYRGQNADYGHLKPSGARLSMEVTPNELSDAIYGDEHMRKFFQLGDKDIDGWKEYRQVITEAIIQHYGGKTYCMDFVDNHWCALWFGVYKFENGHYHERIDDQNLYIYLYVADTNCPTLRGMYIGEDTYTVDLRKAIPSTCQRPASQYGWVVRKKDIDSSGCNYDDNVVGVIEVGVKDAIEWIGKGELLSEENFFPSFNIDEGYNVLLQRQQRSGVWSSKKRVLPPNTIQNYHLQETIYCSDWSNSICPKKTLYTNGKKICNIEQLYRVLLENGWQKDTCQNKELWNDNNPWESQSLATAVLVYMYFEGEIYHRKYSKGQHYFNIVNGIVIDLASQELHTISSKPLFYKNDEKGKVQKTNIKQTATKNSDCINRLLHNCGIEDAELPAISKDKSGTSTCLKRIIKKR